ncbi:hypothetical protein M0R04_10320 [Candidatus Dojkabacteria bacterium]|jgi:hypothetical protein|nr:hypothetical protein [Candidatus Dojkabacteria bacterium]
MIITITVPKEGENWRILKAQRKSPELVIKFLERKIMKYLRTDNKQKLQIRIKHDGEYINSTLNTVDVPQAMFATACFLEDYLTDSAVRRLMEKYGNN